MMPWKMGSQLLSRRWASSQAAHLHSAATRPAVLALGWGASTRRPGTTPLLASSSPLLSAALLPQRNYKFTGKIEQSVTARYPTLHEAVAKAFDNVPQPAPLFQHHGHKSKVIKDYTTSIMGRFQCRDHKCSSPSWGSKKIAIQIREFAGNTYDAVVYKQRCRTCGNLGTMRIDEESYVERVAYRLKKWAGVRMERPEYNEEGEGPPHKSSLCEGCKAGCCPMLKRSWAEQQHAHGTGRRRLEAWSMFMGGAG